MDLTIVNILTTEWLSGVENVGCSSASMNLFAPLVLVVLSVVVFAIYYLSDGSRFLFFFLRYAVFITCMYLMVEVTSWYFLIVGWERMGVCSYYLISTFSGRSLANASSAAALTYNRVGDIFLFVALVSGLFVFIFVAVLTKSSMTLFCGWLPNAMEGPTPVSALLHSSTMVVAGVYMTVVFTLSSLVLTLILLVYRYRMGAKGATFGDHKRVIAFSTSSQLVFVAVLGLLGGGHVAVLYVFVHAYFKSLMFMICGYHIHATNTQGIVNSNNTVLMVGSLVCLATMSGYPFFNVAKIKDQFLFVRGWESFLFVHVFILYAWATVVYSMRLSTLRAANLVLFSVGGIYVVRALLLSLGGFARGCLSVGSTYGVATLVESLLFLVLLKYLVQVVFNYYLGLPRIVYRAVGAVDADSYIKSIGAASSWRLPVSHWGRPSLVFMKSKVGGSQ